MTLSSKWFEDTRTAEDKKTREEFIHGAQVLDILKTIVSRDIERLESTSLSDYDNPNWAFLEADRHGQLRALKQILSLTARN